MGTTIPPNFTGRLEKYGEDADGDTSEAVLIAAVQVPAINGPSNQNRGNAHKIVDFSVSVAKSGSNTRVYIQKSNDNSSWTKVATIIIPDYGNYHRVYGQGIIIRQGQWWRVIHQQDTAARVTCEVQGKTAYDDVVDL